MKTVLLLSAGIDSTVCLAHGIAGGHDMYCLSVWYGGLHQKQELNAIRELRRQYDFEWKQVTIQLPVLDSALLDVGMTMSAAASVVPMRNTLLLSLAASWAYTLVADNIWLGANFDDQHTYVDCRPIFINAYNEMLQYAMDFDNTPKVELPLIDLNKKDIVKYGDELGVDWSKTWSCYTPKANKPCLECPACLLRLETFSLLGKIDPLTT